KTLLLSPLCRATVRPSQSPSFRPMTTPCHRTTNGRLRLLLRIQGVIPLALCRWRLECPFAAAVLAPDPPCGVDHSFSSMTPGNFPCQWTTLQQLRLGCLQDMSRPEIFQNASPLSSLESSGDTRGTSARTE